MQFIGQFVLKVSRSCVVRGERGVIFLFSAKRPPRKGALSNYLRRAGQRRSFQRVFLAFFLSGPAFTAFRQSLPTEKSLPVRPKLRIIQAARIRCSRYKNIDVCRLPSQHSLMIQTQLLAGSSSFQQSHDLDYWHELVPLSQKHQCTCFLTP